MSKDKTKKSKKDKASADVLEVAALSLKKFRKVTKQISKLSTGQKLVGGLALAAAGLTYLAARQTTGSPDDSVPALAANEPTTADQEPRKTLARKGHKSHRNQSE